MGNSNSVMDGGDKPLLKTSVLHAPMVQLLPLGHPREVSDTGVSMAIKTCFVAGASYRFRTADSPRRDAVTARADRLIENRLRGAQAQTRTSIAGPYPGVLF
jgi:hypothetical protein